MRGAKNFEHGFSLIEILASVAILALIGLLAFGTASQSMSAREKATKIASFYQGISRAMNRMATEISMAFVSQHEYCSDPRMRTVFASERSGYGMGINFSSFSQVNIFKDYKSSDVNEIGYKKWAAALTPILATLGFLETEPDNFTPEEGF